MVGGIITEQVKHTLRGLPGTYTGWVRGSPKP